MNEFLSVLAILAPIIVAIFQWWLRRCEITWVVLPPKSVVEVAEEISDRVERKFDGKPVDNLIRFQFILHNSGKEAFDGEDRVPLIWTGPGTVLEACVQGTLPSFQLQVRPTDERVEINWKLLNPRCQALIDVLCDHPRESVDWDIVSQIRNVTEPKLRYASYFDEEGARSRLEKSFSRRSYMSTFPRLRRIFVFVGVFTQRHSARVVAGYMSFAVGYVAGVIALAFGMKLVLSILLGGAFAAAILVLSFFLLRNPYAKLLRRCASEDNDEKDSEGH
jgi:hypothetical protein